MKVIRVLSTIWWIIGMLAFGAVVLVIIVGENAAGVLVAVLAGIASMTVAVTLDGFATIVGYFERASKKQGK